MSGGRKLTHRADKYLKRTTGEVQTVTSDTAALLQVFSDFRESPRDLPGGAVVKNPPASAGDHVRSQVREDATCRGATKPVRHNY